ncbi:MAG: GNAT family N-acetyltransferase [Segetibacter sp.]
MDLSQYHIIEGEFITLRTINESDAEDIYMWRTSTSGVFMNQPKNYSVDSQLMWIKTRPKNEVNYIIYANDGNEGKLGAISIVDIDEQNKKAEVGRLLLNEKYLNVSSPYGLEALKLTYDLVLNKWKFNKIYGNILASNTRMVKMQTFLGMEQEGTLKKHVFLNYKFVDINLYCIFSDVLNSKYIPKINFLLRSFQMPIEKKI